MASDTVLGLPHKCIMYLYVYCHLCAMCHGNCCYQFPFVQGHMGNGFKQATWTGLNVLIYIVPTVHEHYIEPTVHELMGNGFKQATWTRLNVLIYIVPTVHELMGTGFKHWTAYFDWRDGPVDSCSLYPLLMNLRAMYQQMLYHHGFSQPRGICFHIVHSAHFL
jgi:hypothetical protein